MRSNESKPTREGEDEDEDRAEEGKGFAGEVLLGRVVGVDERLWGEGRGCGCAAALRLC